MIQRIGQNSFKHPFLTFGAWFVALALIVVGASTLGSKFVTSGSLPGTDSQRAYDILAKALPAAKADTATIVVHSRDPLTAPATAATLKTYLSTTRHIVPGGQVSESAVSPDGRTALYDVVMPAADRKAADGGQLSLAVADKLLSAAKAPRHAGLQVEYSGGWFTQGSVPANAELMGLVVAVIVLLLLFGSLLALGVTLAPALLAVLGTGSLITMLTHVVPTPDVTTTVATMIGLGVGIDYALFLVARFRRELVTHEPAEAWGIAMRTAGRAVVLAGSTVAIALLGMLLLRVDFIRGLAVGAAVAVVTAVVASLTLLPALLRLSAKRMSRQVRRRAYRTSRTTFWTRWGKAVTRRPALALIVGGVLVVLLSVPALSMRLSYADASSDPTTSTTRRAYDLTSSAFGPGYLGPFVVAVDHATPSGVSSVRHAIAKAPGVVSVTPAMFSKDGSVAVFNVVPSTGPQDARTEALVHQLRTNAIAKTGVDAHIGGQTPMSIDFSELMRSRLPWFIGGVLFCSFLMLLVVFRSIAIPLQAVFLNLVSITAAFGVTVAVFQWGWFAHLFGLSGGAPIDPWIPMLLFAILFGLSMDYEVFLLSSVKEHYDRDPHTARAVVAGMSNSARVITGAAAIMIAVFGAFVTSELRGVQLVGFGLAIAVLIDATIIRMLLVPALMTVLGHANWWLPTWLAARLPHVSVESAEPTSAAPERELVAI